MFCATAALLFHAAGTVRLLSCGVRTVGSQNAKKPLKSGFWRKRETPDEVGIAQQNPSFSGLCSSSLAVPASTPLRRILHEQPISASHFLRLLKKFFLPAALYGYCV